MMEASRKAPSSGLVVFKVVVVVIGAPKSLEICLFLVVRALDLGNLVKTIFLDANATLRKIHEVGGLGLTLIEIPA